MLVADLLFDSARERGDRPAVWHEHRWKTYAELGAAAQALAGFWIARGVRPGDRVAILLDNSFDYIVAHFGALAAGAVEVSLNTDLAGDSLKALLADCGATALVAGRKFLRQWKDIPGGLSSLRLVVTDLPATQFPPMPDGVELHAWEVALAAGDGARVTPPREAQDLASIVYTSGSTGKPKGVMLSHRNLVSNTRSIVEYLGLRPDDRMLVVLPFHYIYGRSLLYTHFLSGGAVVLDNRFAFPSAILKTMEEQKVTCFAGVPSTFSILLRKTDIARRSFPHLRLLTQAGGPMAPTLQQEVARTFPSAQLFVMYGSTEAAPRLTYLAPGLLGGKAGSIGRGIPGVEVVVVDEAGARLPRGSVGEIAARGPNIMLGYWNDPEGSAAVLRNGWYLTGDLGYEDEDGCLFITGRARDIIKAGGNRVSAKDVEEKILELPEVVEAAVIGVADEILGEAIKAFVVVHGATLTEAQVRAHLQRRLASFAQPKFVEFTASLPKNQAGKILKAVLREREAATAAR